MNNLTFKKCGEGTPYAGVVGAGCVVLNFLHDCGLSECVVVKHEWQHEPKDASEPHVNR